MNSGLHLSSQDEAGPPARNLPPLSSHLKGLSGDVQCYSLHSMFQPDKVVQLLVMTLARWVDAEKATYIKLSRSPENTEHSVVK